VAPDVKLQIGGQVFTRDDALIGSFVHVALSEMARAAFDVLEIPVWGREEHAADRVAGYLMFQFGEKVAYRTLMGTSLVPVAIRRPEHRAADRGFRLHARRGRRDASALL